MATRLPRPKLLRGLIKRRIVSGDAKTVALINSRLDDPATYRALNEYFTTNRGSKWVDRFKVWCDWLWLHKDAILRILGLVLMFTDGEPTLKTIEDVEAEAKAKAVAEKKKKKVAPLDLGFNK